MKKIIALISILFTSLIYPQNWTSVIETDIDVSSATSVDIFTNGDGNHIIVQESSSLKYYNMDVEGNNSTPVTLESTAVISPSITGNNEDIYVVYRKSNETYIRTKYSTNGGSTWQYLSTNPLESNADAIESAFSNDNLHVVYEVSDDIKYSKYSGSWSSPYIVSNTEDGEQPRIFAYYDSNNDYVYFLYAKKNTDKGKWRRYDVDANSWGTLYEGYSLSSVIFSYPVGLRATDSRIFIYYGYYAEDWLGQNRYYLNWVVRNTSNGLLNNGFADVNNFTNKIYSTTTNDNVSHSVLYYTWIADEENEIGVWRSNSNNGYPSDLIYEYSTLQYFPYHLNLSSAGNDVHVIWQDDLGSSNGDDLRYAYDDQDPLAPTNLAVEKSKNNHPYLYWDANNDPDIDKYNIYKFITDWQFLTSTSNLYYEDTDEDYCTAPPPQQCTNEHNISYRIAAEDLGSNESDYSNTVVARVLGGPPAKLGGGNSGSSTVVEYSLKQNYPNPFNPITTIDYSIKSEGLVALKVYDMLGKEVASLVNGWKEPGNYSVTFNAENLPSGIYVYKLTAGKFTETKKLLLLR